MLLILYVVVLSPAYLYSLLMSLSNLARIELLHTREISKTTAIKHILVKPLLLILAAHILAANLLRSVEAYSHCVRGGKGGGWGQFNKQNHSNIIVF